MASPAKIKKYLKGINYPITKPEVIQTAKDKGADKLSIEVLCRIAGQKFDNQDEIIHSVEQVNIIKK